MSVNPRRCSLLQFRFTPSAALEQRKRSEDHDREIANRERLFRRLSFNKSDGSRESAAGSGKCA